ncbi:hypothetical protein C8R44DRAFT_892390 [Mycena epipterygia]|nr:hypothetical protein C8R44DRAFT_892390 [Mycena epipterygia]
MAKLCIHLREQLMQAISPVLTLTHRRATVKPRNISPRSTGDLVLALVSDALSRVTYPRPPDSENETREREGDKSVRVAADCATKARATEGCLHVHSCLRVLAAAHSSLPVLRASYDTAHTALRPPYVARVRSRRRRSFTPSTFTPQLAARDGAQSHRHRHALASTAQTPTPLYTRTCAVPPPVRMRQISRPRTHPRRGKHRPMLAPHASHASPYIHTRAYAVPPRIAARDAVPGRASRAMAPTVDSAYVNAPGHAAALRARGSVHNAAPIDARHHRIAAAHTAPSPTHAHPASPRRNSPRCISAHDISLRASSSRRAFWSTRRLPAPQLAPTERTPATPIHAPRALPNHRCISARIIRAQRAPAPAPRTRHAIRPA